ncbi:hypothetical protein AB0M68_29945 [Streptomyces sp. NPDC051453]|uniref:hypothetical protein n=1 Tax=Streptomyces sp. NPDC051453 TaxID=3154941 RepID=UPI0034302F79
MRRVRGRAEDCLCRTWTTGSLTGERLSLTVAGPDALNGLTETALSADPLLQPRRFDACVALELVIEVRHRITSPHIFLNVGAPAQTFAADTRLLAEEATHRLAAAIN